MVMTMVMEQQQQQQVSGPHHHQQAVVIGIRRARSSYEIVFGKGLDIDEVEHEYTPMDYEQPIVQQVSEDDEDVAVYGLATFVPQAPVQAPVQATIVPVQVQAPITRISAAQRSPRAQSNSRRAPSTSRVTTAQAPLHIKAGRAMTEEETCALLVFFQQAPALATSSFQNQAMYGKVKGATVAHILPGNGEAVHCFHWDSQNYISSFDIFKCLQVLLVNDALIKTDEKKLEECIFSVLRQIKGGSRMEESKSELLLWLLENNCIRTLKKQKVYPMKDVNLLDLAREVRAIYHRAHLNKTDEGTGPSSKKRRLVQVDAMPIGNMVYSPSAYQPAMYPQGMYAPIPSAIPQAMYAPAAYVQPAMIDHLAPAVSDPYTPIYVSDRKHTCKFCGVGFKRAEHLKRHERSHTGEKIFSCKHCVKQFARSETLKQHMKRDHAELVEDDSASETSMRSPRMSRSEASQSAQGDMSAEMPEAYEAYPGFESYGQMEPLSPLSCEEEFLNCHCGNPAHWAVCNSAMCPGR